MFIEYTIMRDLSITIFYKYATFLPKNPLCLALPLISGHGSCKWSCLIRVPFITVPSKRRLHNASHSPANHIVKNGLLSSGAM